MDGHPHRPKLDGTRTTAAGPRPVPSLGAPVTWRRGVLRGTLVLLAGALVGCSTVSGVPSMPQSATSSTAGPAPTRYISLGDSYAAGSAPSGGNGGSTTGAGFPYQIVDRSAERGRPLELLNLGCSGATSQQIVAGNGCQPAALGPGATPYVDRSQAGAALDAMRADPASVALVTVVVGANDVQRCLFDVDPQACLADALPPLVRNVTELVQQIRAEVGPQVPIVGLTYLNPYLAASVVDPVEGERLSAMSDRLFRTTLNPALQAAYTGNGALFVDITALVDSQGGTAAAEVAARTCELTFYCEFKDIHPTPEGHALIADAVLAAAFGI